jgi:ATP-dependent Lon protease
MNTDTAFFDRIHFYLPGWEIPKFRPEHFTNRYGFIVDYLAEYLREMRKRSFTDELYKYFKLGKNLNQRDTIAVNKTFSALMKLVYSDGSATKDDIREILQYALEGRRRVKEQLKKIGGMEFYDVDFSYIDKETLEEHYVAVTETGGTKLIPDGLTKPGQVYTIGISDQNKIGVYKIELQVTAGTGKFEKSGLGTNSEAKEGINTAINYFKANAKSISHMISTTEKDYYIQVQDMNGVGMTKDLALASFISFCSGALEKPVQEQLAILGTMTIGGTISIIDNLSDLLQVCLEAGAKRIIIPMSSAAKIQNIPPELFSKFQISFYEDPIDAAHKTLGLS